MSINVPFARGRNTKIAIRQNGVKIIAVFRTTDFEEIAQEVQDDVNGEDRSRFDIVTDGYQLSLEGYSPDFAHLDAWLADTANNDLANAPFSKAAQVTFALLDGSTALYRLSGQNSSRGKFKVTASDRKAAVMQGCTYRFQYMQKVNV